MISLLSKPKKSYAHSILHLREKRMYKYKAPVSHPPPVKANILIELSTMITKNSIKKKNVL